MTVKVISLINQKGGCGKSSTCFHLGGHFAASGLNTLLVDADPQGSLSQGFFGSSAIEALESRETIAALFDDEQFLSDPQSLVLPTAFERISVVRSNHTLAPHNIPQPERLGMKQYVLKQFLETLESFDIILIDCPPNLYQASWAAMIAATSVLIPVPPEDFATQGLRVVHQAIENAQALNPDLRLLGHLVTRSDGRLLIHRSFEDKLRQLYGSGVLKTVVPESSAFKVALACRTPVSQYSPKSPAAKTMAKLGDEVLSRDSSRVSTRRIA